MDERLSRLLGGADVTELAQLSGGASRHTFRFRADGELRIAQVSPGETGDLATEAALLRVVRAAGAPVAAVLAFDDELGPPMIVSEFVPGETIARKILRDDEFAAARARLAAECGAALAHIHATAVAELPALPFDDPLARTRDALDVVGEPHPVFELAFRWLEDHAPPARPTSLVHGDFRLGNLIVGADGLRCVVDWELAYLGNPMMDLGWVTTKAWRFGSAPPVAGVGDRAELLDAYAEAGGAAVSLDELRWWEVVGSLRWGVMCLTQASRHFSGTTRSHELVAIGRRAVENEHDLLELLQGEW